MNEEMESVLVSTCLALGGFEEQVESDDDQAELQTKYTQVYVMGDECLECLKDIKRFIRYHDEPGDNKVLEVLGEVGVLQKDLIPIMLLNTPADDSVKERLVLACIELMVPMTWLIDYKALQEHAIMEEDNSIVGNLHERLQVLRAYKQAFLKPNVLDAIFQVLLKPLSVEYRTRTIRDHAIIRLCLCLFRNLVAIRDSEDSVSGTMEQYLSSIMQEELLKRFQEENVLDLLITLASSARETQLAEWNVVTLEIYYYIFLGIEPKDILPEFKVSGGTKNENSALKDLLAKEKKQRPPQWSSGHNRHSRFGGTLEVRLQDGSKYALHNKAAFFTTFESQLDAVKTPRARNRHTKSITPDYRKRLSTGGKTAVRNIATAFLESCFNPLMSSLRRDIESEREKVKPHHKLQYLYLLSFFLEFQRRSRDVAENHHSQTLSSAKPNEIATLQENYEQNILPRYDFDLVGTALEVKSLFQVVTFMRDRTESEQKEWNDVQQAVDCIREMLLTLYAMGKSSNEEYRELSENVQNNLYYEQATLDLFSELISKFKVQSIGYLESALGMVHILLKTLEAFSKSKAYMFVSKKVAIRKKKAKAARAAEAAKIATGISVDGVNSGTQEEAVPTDANNDDQLEDQQDDDQPSHTMREHVFQFKEFERRFANEQVIQTYCTFLEGYQTLEQRHLHWIATMFHRIAVHCGNEVVFYKLSTLQLFHTVMQANLASTQVDMMPFFKYILTKFFKKLRDYPLLMAEVFFPKPSKVCMEIQLGRDQIEKEQEVLDLQAARKKDDAMKRVELKVSGDRSIEEQIQIVIMALFHEEKEHLIRWVISVLGSAVEKRTLQTFRTAEELAENPDLMYSTQGVEDILIETTSDIQRSLIREPRLRLMLKLLTFEMNETMDGELKYTIPKALATDALHLDLELIQSAFDKEIQRRRDGDDGDLDEEGNELNYDELIKKLKPKVAKKTPVEYDSDGEPIVKAKKTKTAKEEVVYKSAEYIIDSDVDEEADAAYFEQEALRRVQRDRANKEELQKHRKAAELARKSKEAKSKGKGKARVVALDDDEELERSRERNSDSEQEAEDGILKRATYGGRRTVALADSESDNADEEEEDEDEEPLVSRRGLFNTLRGAAPSEATLEEHEEGEPSEHKRVTYGTQRTLLANDDSDSEDYDTPTKPSSEPLPESQSLAISTPTRVKRQLLLDSDDDMDDGENNVEALGRPVKKLNLNLDSDEANEDL